MFYVASYDSPSNKRRRKIMELCKDYLFHIQGSVFEGNLSRYKFNKLLERMKLLVDAKNDSLRIYVISESALNSTIVIGKPDLVRDKAIISIEEKVDSPDEILPFD